LAHSRLHRRKTQTVRLSIVGDLYFDTSTNTMKVYAQSGWTAAGSSVNGTADRFNYTATAGQTTFTGADDNNNTLAYDGGYADIYMNGVKLAPADYTATSGTSVVLASGAALNDAIEIIAYGTFTLSNQSMNDHDRRYHGEQRRPQNPSLQRRQPAV
jgi:hypothetical protein